MALICCVGPFWEKIATVEQREKARQQSEDRRPTTPDRIVDLSIGVAAEADRLPALFHDG